MKKPQLSLVQLVTLGSSIVRHVLQKHVTKRSLSLWNENYLSIKRDTINFKANDKKSGSIQYILYIVQF